MRLYLSSLVVLLLCGCNVDVNVTTTKSKSSDETVSAKPLTATSNDTDPTPTPSPTPSPKLVAEYLFNGNLNDEYGNNAETSNAVTFTSGCHGGGVSFSGDHSFIRIPSVSAINTFSAMSISVAVYPTGSAPAMDIISKHTDSGNTGYLFWLKDGKFSANFDGSGIDGTQDIPLNQWTQLTTTFDDNGAKYYINGSLAGTRDYSGSISATTEPLTIGRHSHIPDYYFQGKIDEVRIYNYSLTESEVLSAYDPCQ